MKKSSINHTLYRQILIGIFLFGNMCASLAWNGTVVIDSVEYTRVGDDAVGADAFYAVEVTAYLGRASQVTIPSEFLRPEDTDGTTRLCRVVGIGDSAFLSNQRITEVVLPSTIEYIGKFSFYGCRNLNEINFPQGLVVIDYYAFVETGLRGTLVFPSSVREIGSYSFENVHYIDSVSFAEGLVRIGHSAFSSLASIHHIYIPSTVEWIGVYAFPDRAMQYIQVSPNNQHYCSVDGVLYNKDMSTLIQYPALKPGPIHIPSSVQTLGSGAFMSVRMDSLIVPNTVTTIGHLAFGWCDQLRYIELPSGITQLEGYTFAGCTELMTITIPENVTRILSNAFIQCNLKHVHFNSQTPPTIEQPMTFGVAANNCNLYYPCGCAEAYSNTLTNAIGEHHRFEDPTGRLEVSVRNNFGRWLSDTCNGSGVTLVAHPEAGYMFERWSDGSVENPRDVDPSENNAYTAIFASDPNYTDINTADNEPQVSIYPNPTKEVLYVEGNDLQALELYDIQGRLVLSQTYNHSPLRISHLPSGRYLMRAISTHGEAVRYIVKK